MKKLKLKKPSWKKILLFSTLGILLLIIVFVLGSLFNDNPPEFFPLDNPRGQYIIAKGCPNGMGGNEKVPFPTPTQNYYCVEYKGPGVYDAGNKKGFFRITVGKSPVDLAPLLGKRIKHIKGEFTMSAKQCTGSKCVNLGDAWIVLNMDSFEAAE